MHSLLCSLKAGIREQPLIACPCCRPCRGVNCVLLDCRSLLLYMVALSNGFFFFSLVFLHVIFWEKPSFSGGFKLLFEGHCVHISKQAGFGNTPDWNAMISPLCYGSLDLDVVMPGARSYRSGPSSAKDPL